MLRSVEAEARSNHTRSTLRTTGQETAMLELGFSSVQLTVSVPGREEVEFQLLSFETHSI